MAHKKGVGSSKNGRDSQGQRLGIKRYGGQKVSAGSIIVRQKGQKFKPGPNAAMGRDHCVFAKIDGRVMFEKKKGGSVLVSIEAGK